MYAFLSWYVSPSYQPEHNFQGTLDIQISLIFCEHHCCAFSGANLMKIVYNTPHIYNSSLQDGQFSRVCQKCLCDWRFFHIFGTYMYELISLSWSLLPLPSRGWNADLRWCYGFNGQLANEGNIGHCGGDMTLGADQAFVWWSRKNMRMSDEVERIWGCNEVNTLCWLRMMFSNQRPTSKWGKYWGERRAFALVTWSSHCWIR